MFSIKDEQKHYNVWWYWNQKPTISNIKIKKFNMVSIGKKSFKYVIGYKDDENVWEDMQKVLMKLNACLSLTKNDEVMNW